MMIGTGLAWEAMSGMKCYPSIPDHIFHIPDPISHILEMRNLMMVDLEFDEEEIQLARRDPMLDILAEDEDAEIFQFIKDCLARLQPSRSLCD
jgi:hypothetical protein